MDNMIFPKIILMLLRIFIMLFQFFLCDIIVSHEFIIVRHEFVFINRRKSRKRKLSQIVSTNSGIPKTIPVIIRPVISIAEQTFQPSLLYSLNLMSVFLFSPTDAQKCI